MVDRISTECSPRSGRNLLTMVTPPDQRRAWFKSKVVDVGNGEVVEVVANESNRLDRMMRESCWDVMEESLVGTGIHDPKDALWSQVKEPTLGDMTYGEAQRGYSLGIGDDVPPYTFLYRWVLSSLTTSLTTADDLPILLPDVQAFPVTIIHKVLSSMWAHTPVVDQKDFLILTCSSGTAYLIEDGKMRQQLAIITRLMLPFPKKPSYDDDDGGNQGPKFYHLNVLQGYVTTDQSHEASSSSSSSAAADALGCGYFLTISDLLCVEGASIRKLTPQERGAQLQEMILPLIGPDSNRLGYIKTVHRRAGFQQVKIANTTTTTTTTTTDKGLDP